MLKRKFRLPRGIKFEGSRIISTPFFIIKSKENGLLLDRFSIVVSKKINRSAVVRNRIKRLISSCIEDLSKVTKRGCDMIIIAKIKTHVASRQDFCHDLNQYL